MKLKSITAIRKRLKEYLGEYTSSRGHKNRVTRKMLMAKIKELLWVLGG